MHQIARRAGAITAVALLSLGLASCSGGQSTAEACEILNESVADVVNDAQSETSALMSDFAAGEEVDFAAAFAEAQTALADAQKQVTNEEVSQQLDAFVAEYDGLVAVFDDLDLSAYQELAKQTEEIDYTDTKAVEELQTKSEELMAQSQELTDSLTEKQETFTAAWQAISDTCTA